MDTTAAGLSRHLGPLRRALLRATRRAANLPDIPDAQIEVLRALVAEPGQSPGAVAADLGLAKSTVSNLVRAMLAAGLIDRAAASGDGDLRRATLTASPRSVHLLADFDRVSTEVLSDALAELSAEDRRALEAAVPVLETLTTMLRRTAADGST